MLEITSAYHPLGLFSGSHRQPNSNTLMNLRAGGELVSAEPRPHLEMERS